MNIYDISAKAGVSIATVSRVLNGSARVSEKTREKVLAVMRECDYVPNAFARGLGLNTMKTIGILCATAADPFLARGIACLEQSLRENGYDCLLCCSEYSLEMRQKGVELLLSKRVDSIVLMGSHYVENDDANNEYIRQAAKNVPVLLVNASLAGENIYSILCDDYHATMEATLTLLDAGRKDILYLYHSHNYSGRKKLQGYRDALQKRGRPVREELIHYYAIRDRSVQDVRDELLRVAAQGLSFDAVMTSDDTLAVGAAKYARAAKRSVPRGLSIIGYNNSGLALCTEPELTSVDNKLDAICHQCVQTLLGVLSGKEMPQKTVFTAELAHRGSTIQ